MANQGGRPQGPGMPSPGADGGRKRNTMANMLSKYTIDYKNTGGGKALPAMSPASTANYYSQLGALQGQYQATVAGLRNQRVGARAAFGVARSDARTALISGVTGVQQESQDRGMLGSSAESQSEIGVRAQSASDIATAKGAMVQQLGALQVQKQAAAADLYSGQTQLEGQRIAEQETALAQQLQNNLIISGQETQMDAMKAVYNALSKRIQDAVAARTSGGGGGGSGGNGGGGGGGGGVRIGGAVGLGQAPQSPAGTPDTLAGLYAQLGYYQRGRQGGSQGIGLPTPGRPGVRF